MFAPEDFELPLEKELRLRVINAEIDECTNVEALQEHLKQCASSLVKYQHLLSKSIEKHLLSDISAWVDKIEKDTKPQ